MRILQPNYEKSVGKGHLFKRVIIAGTLEWRGTLQLLLLFLFFWCMCVLNPTIWAAHPILHMWIFSPLGPSCRGTPNNSDFINLRNSSLWEFRNQAIKKKCWKGAPFSMGNLSWNIWMKGTLAFCDSKGPLPPIGSSCRGTQIILMSSIYGMHRYRILQPNYEKKCWKGLC